MALGETFAAEGRRFADPLTKTPIRQFTDYRAHSHHLYFTNSGLWDEGGRLLIGSHRNNAANLYSVELSSGRTTQLTDFPPEAKPNLQCSFVNPRRVEAYFTCAGELLALDLRTLRRRAIYRSPDGYNTGMLSCTADGKTVCMAVSQDLSEKIRMDVGHGYVGFAEYSAAHPHCRIVGIPTGGGEARVLHEEKFWLSHVNTSHVLPDVLTFCHEGPWDAVEQRMWTLNVATGSVQPLQPQVPGEAIGHEYWFADGKRVGYHGRKDGVHRFGWVWWNGRSGEEYDFPHGSFHFHSMDETLIVGDGARDNPHLLL